MFTIRNMGGIALFLFGTTFLWLTPMFATKGLKTDGAMWSTAAALSFATCAGFTLATYGLFAKTSWWEAIAVASAALGVLALVPYTFAATHAGETTPLFNVAVHALGSIGVFVLLLVPALERWVSNHVMGG